MPEGPVCCHSQPFPFLTRERSTRRIIDSNGQIKECPPDECDRHFVKGHLFLPGNWPSSGHCGTASIVPQAGRPGRVSSEFSMRRHYVQLVSALDRRWRASAKAWNISGTPRSRTTEWLTVMSEACTSREQVDDGNVRVSGTSRDQVDDGNV